LRALLTESTLESGMSATSFAWNPRTSRRMRTATGGKDLKRGHESQGDGFGLFVAGLRAERHVDNILEEGVGKWLEPHDLAEPGRLGRFNLGHVPLLGLASADRATRIEAAVGGGPVEPGAD